jgi:hypothetical protein
MSLVRIPKGDAMRNGPVARPSAVVATFGFGWYAVVQLVRAAGAPLAWGDWGGTQTHLRRGSARGERRRRRR